MKDFDKYCSPYSPSELRERLGKIRHVAFDMDGTIYMGSTLFPFTVATLQRLRDNGIGYSFLTNNPSRSIDAYLAKLAGMGIDSSREQMYTTAIATVDYIRTHHAEARNLYLLGTPSMVEEFVAAGQKIRQRISPLWWLWHSIRPCSTTASAVRRGGCRRVCPTSQPIPTASARPISRPCWSIAARSASVSSTPRVARPTSRSASPTRIC